MTSLALRQRPEVLGSDFKRFWSLTWTLAITDFKLRFYGSALGVAWSLLRPFALFGVIYVVFVEIAKVGEDVKNFPAYILVSMILFQFWGEIVGGCVDCLVQRENLLRKMRFPRLVIPFSIAVGALLNLGMTLIAVLGFIIAVTGLTPTLEWLELIPVVLVLLTFGLGLGLLLGALFVRFRDIAPIWDVVAQMLFYASPILYVATNQVPGDWLQLYLCNPLASLFTEIRHAMMDPKAAGVFEAMGVKALIPAAVIVVTLALGAWVFTREAPRVAENL